MPRASRQAPNSIPEEVDDFKLVMNRLGMESVKIGEYTHWYNPRLTTTEKAFEELRKALEADTAGMLHHEQTSSRGHA